MTRHTIWAGWEAKAAASAVETRRHGRLRFYLLAAETSLRTGKTHYGVMAWSGRAEKPFANYTFRTADDRDEWIGKQIASEDRHAIAKLERAAYLASAKAEMREKLTVGTILYTSWGYEQTNVEFYEIVARKGDTVTLRELAQEHDATGPMSATVMPRRGVYLREAFTRRITADGVKIHSSARARVWDGAAKYASWYH